MHYSEHKKVILIITVVRYIFYGKSVILISSTVFDTKGHHDDVTCNINIILLLYPLTVNNMDNIPSVRVCRLR